MSAISIQNLTRDYGSGKGVFDLTFDVGQSEAFGFLGPNGAGKTTTIRHLMGFIRPKMGSCTIGGRDCWTKRADIQKTLGYIPGENAFFDDMSGVDYLNFVAKYRREHSDIRKKQLIDRFDLDPKGKIKKMSKGMKQKIGIIAAFMHDPEVLILDEPTSGLDPLMQNRFVELVAEERTRGKTILMSSHMFEEVERTCHRIGIIREGRLVVVDNVDALRERHMRTYTVTLPNEQTAAEFAADFKGKTNGRNVTVAASMSLEDVFMQYYDMEGE